MQKNTRYPKFSSGNVSLAQSIWRIFWKFLKELSVKITYDTSLTIFNIYPKKCKSLYSFKECPFLSTAALVVVVKNNKNIKVNNCRRVKMNIFMLCNTTHK